MAFSARQALICAAVTGWRGDAFSPWQSPMPEADIVAWGASYLRTEDGLPEAFAALVREGLFRRVLYPIFGVPVYYCSYEEWFLDELPTPVEEVMAGGNSITDLKDLWSGQVEENDAEYGTAWRYWGVCAGQGSQSGGSGWGPCLGPGCYWFIDGKPKCNWELPFIEAPRTGFPDTRFLHALQPIPDEDTVNNALKIWRERAPELPWPKEF